MKLTKKQGMAAGIALLLLIAVAAALGLRHNLNSGTADAPTPAPAEKTGDSLIPTKSAAPGEAAPAPENPVSASAAPSVSAAPAAAGTVRPLPTAKSGATSKPTAAPKPVPADTAARPAGTETPAPAQDKAERLCTVIVRCDTVLSNMDRLKKEKRELIPADGILFKSENAECFEDETVFNVLQRELKKNKVHFDFSNTPAYDTAYVKGIGNLYERDCGELSGWMFKVNGTFIQTGCSQYKLSPGDTVEWVYTCDAGRDIGAEAEAG